MSFCFRVTVDNPIEPYIIPSFHGLFPCFPMVSGEPIFPLDHPQWPVKGPIAGGRGRSSAPSSDVTFATEGSDFSTDHRCVVFNEQHTHIYRFV